MPLYAELQIGTELIIYPMPVPRDKEHYKVNRFLQGSTIQVSAIAPLHLFNGELLYARETDRIQRVSSRDYESKEEFQDTMSQLVNDMQREANGGFHSIDPANPLQFSGGFLHIPPEKPKEWEPEPSEPIVVKLKWNKSGGFQNSLDEPDPETCKHRNTDYFIGTGVVCRDCKKKLRT